MSLSGMFSKIRDSAYRMEHLRLELERVGLKGPRNQWVCFKAGQAQAGCKLSVSMTI
jgi:hypothetical protein